ncbi:MAG TPA: hypothetical protein VMH30_12275 [Verrucomicrobiae bacterium]|nr:hypothetical protein [Verrucomicrobiae bacterium]
MNTKHFAKSAKLIALASVLAYGANLHAATPATAEVLGGSVAGQNQFQTVAFGDTAEAGMLHRAYQILASGDHDYKGHRIKAMHAIEAAAKLLGLDLSGDLKDKSSQPLSDDKLREAQGLIARVAGAAEVKDQKAVVRHLNEAVNQIHVALSVR